MSEQQQAQEQAAPAAATESQRMLTGTVASNKMQKTVAVTVERLIKHDRYGKYVRRTTKLLAHDEASECRVGDLVEIVECRRLSARKSWKVARVVKRAGVV